MSATADIGRRKRLVARLRREDGIGLVELLIALLVLNIGIFATLAAFTSGALALRRASHTSTASAIADKYMECFRDASYTNITWQRHLHGQRGREAGHAQRDRPRGKQQGAHHEQLDVLPVHAVRTRHRNQPL